jgi:hypothetical protein
MLQQVLPLVKLLILQLLMLLLLLVVTPLQQPW